MPEKFCAKIVGRFTQFHPRLGVFCIRRVKNPQKGGRGKLGIGN